MDRPDKLREAKSYTREQVQTALVLLDEMKAAAKAAAPASPHKATTAAPHTEWEMLIALDTAAALSACARAVHRVAENACNGYHYEWQEEADQKAEARAVKRAAKLLAPFGVEFTTGGDPRGACFYLKTPKSERHNTWGGKESGWAVV